MQLKITKSNKALHDAVLVCVILLAAAGVYLLLQVFGKSGQTVVITKDGRTVAEKQLRTNDAVEISDEGGYNRIVIDNGSVYMENAGCPDKICVKTGRISKAGETIVCLPHRVVVEIKGKEAVDSVVR